MASVQSRSEGPGFDVDQSAVDRAPQCPTCFNYTMRPIGDDEYACPGCHEQVAVVLVRLPWIRGRDPVIRGRLGDEFVCTGRA